MGVDRIRSMSKNTTSDIMVFGDLIRLKYFDRMPTFEVLARDIERQSARIVADIEMYGLAWIGPRQVLFIQRNSTIELWTA